MANGQGADKNKKTPQQLPSFLGGAVNEDGSINWSGVPGAFGSIFMPKAGTSGIPENFTIPMPLGPIVGSIRAFNETDEILNPEPVRNWRDILGPGTTPQQQQDTFAMQEEALRDLYGPDDYTARQRAIMEQYYADLGASTQAAKQAISGAYGAATGAASRAAEQAYRSGQQNAATIDQIYGGAGARAAGLASGQGLTAGGGTGLGMVGGGTLAAAPNLARAYGLTAADVAGSEGALAAEALRGIAAAGGSASGASGRNLDTWLANTTAGQRAAFELAAMERDAERAAQLAGGLSQIEIARAQKAETLELATLSAKNLLGNRYETDKNFRKFMKKRGINSYEELMAAIDEIGGIKASALFGSGSLGG